MIAPTLGAVVLAVGSWRAIYAALAAIGAILFVAGAAKFRELQAPEQRQSLKPAAVLGSYRKALLNPICLGFTLVNGLVFCGMFAYINVSPLLFMQGLGVSKTAFAGLFALTAFGVIVGASVNNWVVRRRVKPKTVLDATLALAALAALALLGVGLAGWDSTFAVVAIVFVYISTYGLVFPNAAHEAVHPLPDIAGVASAILLSGQMLFGAIGGALGASLYRDGSPLAIGIVMSGASLTAAALYAFWLRPRIEE